MNGRPFALLPIPIAIGIAVLSMTPEMPVVFWIDKGDHVVAFAGLCAALCLSTRRPVLSSALAATAAALVEIAQGAFPSLGRECSFPDLVAGVAAAAGAGAAYALGTRTRRRRDPPSDVGETNQPDAKRG